MKNKKTFLPSNTITLEVPATLEEIKNKKKILTEFLNLLNQREQQLLKNSEEEEETQDSFKGDLVTKKVILEYQGISKEAIAEKFSKEKVEITERDNSIMVVVKFDKSTRINQNSTKITIDGGSVKILNKAKNTPWVISLENSKKGKSCSNLGVFSDTTNAFSWLEKKNYDNFCNKILFNFSTKPILIPSENALLANLYFEVKYWKFAETIIAYDSKMNDVICEKMSSFRCDLVFVAGEVLYLIETKQRKDRNGQGMEALRTIVYRQYPQRLVKYLLMNFPLIIEKLKICVEVGLGYNFDGSVDCSVREDEIDYLKNDKGYETEEFLIAMKENKRRFNKIFK